MKKEILLLVFGAMALMATSANAAHVGINLGIGVPAYGYGAYPPPPVVYQPEPYYAPPPVVYFGGGTWGGDRWHGYHGYRGYRGGHGGYRR